MRNTLIVLFAAALVTTGCRDRQRPRGRHARPSGWITWAVPQREPSVVYPYSVIKGGVRSAKDVEEAVAVDPAVAEHYSGIKVKALETVTLKSDTDAYVSFRKNGRIYWTSQKVHLARGEPVLSDGVNCVRGRCGNRISWKPRSPVLPKEFKEPTSAELDTPQVRTASAEEMPAQPGGTTLGSSHFEALAKVIGATALPPMGGVVATNPVGAIGGGGGGTGGGGGAGPAGGGGGGGTPDSGSTGWNNFLGVVPYIPPAASLAPASPPGPPSIVTTIIWPGPSVGTSILVPQPPGLTPTPTVPRTTPWTPTTAPPYDPPVTPPPDQPPSPPTPPTPPGPLDQPPAPPFPPPDVPPDKPPQLTPEPGTMLLLGAGLVGCAVLRRKRARRTSRSSTGGHAA